MHSLFSNSLGNSSLNSSLNLKSKLANGSSNNIKPESLTKALANAVLCCCPPESSFGFLFYIPDSFNNSATFPTLCLISSDFTPVILSGDAMLS